MSVASRPLTLFAGLALLGLALPVPAVSEPIGQPIRVDPARLPAASGRVRFSGCSRSAARSM